jgi:hypothetical protein
MTQRLCAPTVLADASMIYPVWLLKIKERSDEDRAHFAGLPNSFSSLAFFPTAKANRRKL